uniref:Chalcone synthase n=1 Tax=Physcomitrium patens TaxID=3218 RepID=A9U1T2_PHYPA|nr:hypothetical protein PHYPA_022762 [Physcomitrium patens]
MASAGEVTRAALPRGQPCAEGPACVLGIGTAVPLAEFLQSEYPDFFFNITNCGEKEALKAKFKCICDKSGIKKRHMFLTEEVLKANPGICTYMEPSLNVRHDVVVVLSNITHIVFATTSGVNMPGADHALAKLLGLKPTVKRIMMCQTGYFGGASVLKVAKDLAENIKGARVRAVASEVTAVIYKASSKHHLDGLVGSALFGDGVCVYVVGSDPKPEVEKLLFKKHWAGVTILPESDGAIDGHLPEAGFIFHLMKDVPGLIFKNIKKFLNEARKPVGSPAWNEMFWAVHPEGPAILNQVEAKLKLTKDKMQGSKDILSEFGNRSSASVLFVLDQIRHKFVKMGASTLGEDSEFGFFIGFGPGLTLEVLVLRAAPNSA